MSWLRSPLLLFAPLLIAAQQPVALQPGRAVEEVIAPGQVYAATLRLRRGESADVVVVQQGIDLAVDLLDPDGRLLDSVDSPNGRQGDEPVAILAMRTGAYTLRIRPLGPGEPAGRFTLRIAALRDRTATADFLAARRALREEAARWLGPRSAPLPAYPLFDALVADARVVGLGEATHGSRELNDVRIMLARRLIERHGFRLIALEDSASRWRGLADYIAGTAPAPPPGQALEWGWIGRRARHELMLWVRQWNLAHPADPVRIVGVDPQDGAAARERLTAFLERAYGPDFAAAWAPVAAELAAADEQTQVFGNSDVASEARARLLEVKARLGADAALLALRFGREAVADALASVAEMIQFADFNGGGGPFARSRDWYMAANLFAALEGVPGGAVYWGHNAHVSAAGSSQGPAGAVLRQTLGCSYVALATTFGSGGFVAQVPNDPDDRLAVFELAAGADETSEAVLAASGPGPRLASWRCGGGSAPAWLGEAQNLRWIGGLYVADSLPRAAYRPYRLTAAFDAIVYFPRVTAEQIPSDRPRVPPRPRVN